MTDEIIEDIEVVDGVEIKTVHPPGSPIYNARVRAKIMAELERLDTITGPRWAEALHRGQADPYILERLDEKEALRARLAALE